MYSPRFYVFNAFRLFDQLSPCPSPCVSFNILSLQEKVSGALVYFVNTFVIASPGPLLAGQITHWASLSHYLSGDRLPEKHCKYTKSVFFFFFFYPLLPLLRFTPFSPVARTVCTDNMFFVFFSQHTSQLLTNTFCFSVPRR